jgi:hypothetical protein
MWDWDSLNRFLYIYFFNKLIFKIKIQIKRKRPSVEIYF